MVFARAVLVASLLPSAVTASRKRREAVEDVDPRAGKCVLGDAQKIVNNLPKVTEQCWRTFFQWNTPSIPCISENSGVPEACLQCIASGVNGQCLAICSVGAVNKDYTKCMGCLQSKVFGLVKRCALGLAEGEDEPEEDQEKEVADDADFGEAVLMEIQQQEDIEIEDSDMIIGEAASLETAEQGAMLLETAEQVGESQAPPCGLMESKNLILKIPQAIMKCWKTVFYPSKRYPCVADAMGVKEECLRCITQDMDGSCMNMCTKAALRRSKWEDCVECLKNKSATGSMRCGLGKTAAADLTSMKVDNPTLDLPENLVMSVIQR